MKGRSASNALQLHMIEDKTNDALTPEEIRKGRGSLGLNQLEFANLIGVQRSTISTWEHGRQPPRAQYIRKMKNLFGPAWVGLTTAEILDLFDQQNVYGSQWVEFARAVEKKLKEKNTT